MDAERLEFTVEYQDASGVLYFENVKATDLADAKMHILQRSPHVTIKAVTTICSNDQAEKQ